MSILNLLRSKTAYGLLLLGACLSAPVVGAPLPIDIYGQDASISDVRISADGTRLAMVQSGSAGNTVLLIQDLATRKAKGYDLADMKVRDIAWSSDHHVLVWASTTTRMMQFRSSLIEYCGVFSVNTSANGGIKQLLVKNREIALQSSLCDVNALLWNDTGDVLMSARSTGNASAALEMARKSGNKGGVTGEVALYQVDGDSGFGDRIARGDETTRYFVTSPKGYAVARVDHTDRANSYRVLIPKSSDRLRDWQAAFQEESEVANLQVYGANADETALIVGTDRQSGLYALFEMSMADGKIGQPLFEPDGVDLQGVKSDPYTGQVVGAGYTRTYYEQTFFQNDLQSALMNVKAALKDYPSVVLTSWDKQRRKFVIFAQGPTSAGDYFLVDLSSGKLEHIASQRPALRGDNIATVASYTYKARDDLPITAFLTLPLGQRDMAAVKNAPLVVMPHGGPAARDDASFHYWAQALASRGYAVLQMNFRGSDGYGADFRKAGYREWGGKMQDDVTDGVKDAIAKGLADANRICIVGGSYGGYAALAGAAFTPDLYKCAVSINGVSDLEQMLAWEANRYGLDSSIYEYWVTNIGNPDADREMIKARSPARAAQGIAADVLLIHGKDDTVVPYQQSEAMHDALKSAGKSAQLIKLDGEDHWLSSAKTRTEMLKAIEGFLAKHLGSAGSGASAAQSSAN